MSWQTHSEDTDHLTGSNSLSMKIHSEAALCPLDCVRTSAEVSLTVKNQSEICKPLMTSATEGIKHRSHYNASHKNLQKFANLQI